MTCKFPKMKKIILAPPHAKSWLSPWIDRNDY